MGKYGIYNAQPFQYENPTTPNFLGATDFSRFSNKPPGEFALDTLQVPGQQVALIDSLHSAPADSQQIAIPGTPQPPRRKIKTSAIVPSGASTGAFEAHELRDNNKNYFLGKI